MLMKRIINLKLAFPSAMNFQTQILELKRVINDFKTTTKNKSMSLLDLDSRLFSKIYL